MLCSHATGVVKMKENMVKLLSENIKDEIFDLFESSEKEINIISPFIGIQTAKEIVKIIKEKNINVTLIPKEIHRLCLWCDSAFYTDSN